MTPCGHNGLSVNLLVRIEISENFLNMYSVDIKSILISM